MIHPPEASADPTEHADWLELAAIHAPDRDISMQDLIGAIKRTGSSDGLNLIEDDLNDVDDADDVDDIPLDEIIEQEDEKLEGIVDAAFSQIEMRAEYLGDGYPFSVNGVLKANEGAEATMYAFLTTLTALGSDSEKAPESAASLFEKVSAEALANYFGGTQIACTYEFGFPRVDKPSGFHNAVDDLCREMGEGIKCKATRAKTRYVKDDGLDLAMWISFGDDRSNQLSVFGQCTTSIYWRAKINELVPISFCKDWFEEIPAMSPLSAFFVPREIEEKYWSKAANSEYRLVFDRLRIARLLNNIDGDLATRCATWTAAVLM